ncbi:MAG: cation:proton antiporter, partial [Bacteroidetes bacterium]|nr:cation:proton antiporter [Bacteroidota bacterium]
MAHLPTLISDLSLILISAAVISLVFKKLKQPVVLGYIIAGILVGPNFNVFPTVSDPENVKAWGEFGVIILLFSLGLEFSFRKLMKVGASAGITAFSGVTFTLLTGFLIGKLLDWDTINCLFFGGILSISSTTIIIRAYEEMQLKNAKFAQIVTGALIVEDLFAVLLMVLLSSVAVTKSFQGIEMLLSVSKLLFFLILWFISGIFFLPSIIRRMRKLLNPESLLVFSLAGLHSNPRLIENSSSYTQSTAPLM